MAWHRQAIIWTSDGLFTDAYMRYSAPMSQLPVSSHSCEMMENENMVYVQEIANIIRQF